MGNSSSSPNAEGRRDDGFDGFTIVNNPFATPSAKPKTFYSVWLCPAQVEAPGLHGLLSAEKSDGAIRNNSEHSGFGPHVTLATHLGGDGTDEDSRVAQFREFAATIKVLLHSSR